MNFKTAIFMAFLLCSGGLLGMSLPAAAQDAGAPAAPPPPLFCEEDPHFSDFDFWVGEWSVTQRKSGDAAGENTIEKIERGCAILESWKSVGGGTGTSLNYYNPATKKWRQVWVAPPGYLIDIEGGLEGPAMVLTGTITGYGTKTPVPFRGTWTPNADGTVRQFFEQYSEEAKAWQPWFDGLYTRK